MARTTREKPKKNGKADDSGPILVANPPAAIAEDLADSDFDEHGDSEQQDTDSTTDTKDDPRRIPPLQKFDFENQQQWWAWIGQFPDPVTCDLYGYRLFPSVMVQPPADWVSKQKPPTHIFKIKGLITPETNRIVDYEWLRNTWGSGKYQLRLVDRTLKRTQNRQVCTAFVEINEWDTHLCVLSDWSELLPSEGNKWIISRLLKAKIIKRNAEGGFMAYDPGAQENSTNNGTSAPSLKETVDLAERLAKTMAPKEREKDPPLFTGKDIVDLIGKTQQANDPQKVIDAAKGLVEIAKPAEDKSGTTVLTLITTQLTALQNELAAERAENRNLMNKILDNATKQPQSPLESVAANVELVDKIRGNSEGSGAIQSRMNGWQEFLKEPLTEVVNLLKPLATVGAQVLLMKANQGNQQQQQQRPAQQQATQAPTQTTQPAAVPEAAQPAPAPTPQTAQPNLPTDTPNNPSQDPPPEMITPEQQQTQAEARAILTGLAYVMPTLTDYLSDKELGGEAFAAWFCDCSLPTGIPILPKIPGYQAHQTIKKYPAEQIADLIQGNSPPMYQELCGVAGEKKEEFLKFITEFQSYDPDAQQPPEPKGGKKK